MNTKLIVGVLIVLAAGAGWYVYKGKAVPEASENLGSYAYMCENGSQFTMTPSEDASELSLSAGSQGMFTGTVRLAKMGDGPHYETTEGELIVFAGAGEEVQFTVGNEMTTCNPVPNSDMAPWNWGDAGEGAGSAQPDAALVVSESIIGKWKSTDDAKFVREFKSGDVVVDYYEGKEVTNGLFVAFTKGNAPKVFPYPLEDNAVYIQITEKGTQADTLNFKLVKLTPEALEMVYLDRGGILKFTAIK